MIPRDYERWVWLELIGFDNEADDHGAAGYLDTLGFMPEVVSLLITSPDIIHLHDGPSHERAFPDDYCSYFGHRRNADRHIQTWTNLQLKALVDNLHGRGVKVFLSTFTVFLGNRFSREFVSDHRELLEVNSDGVAISSSAPIDAPQDDPALSRLATDYSFDANSYASLMPLKRFADGSFYEDFFAGKLAEVMRDYGFDGWHAADGWGPARLPLSRGDYSDDMFEQFLDHSGVEAPDSSLRQCDGEGDRIRERAAWIRREHRTDWSLFHADRWAAFHRKISALLHADGCQVMMNSAWTRDPFEAILRYGIDYAKLVDAGVDGFVTESAAGAADTEAGCGGRHYQFVAALLLMRAQLPNAKLVFLHGIKDTKEQWDLIHHAPTILEKEVCALANIYQQTRDGLRRCADGFIACLADGIRADEWQWLQRKWDLAFTPDLGRVVGATLIWSDPALAREIMDFAEHRGATTHRLLHTLMAAGAPVHAVARIEDIDSVSGPILLLNAHLLGDDEFGTVMAYGNGPVIIIGRRDRRLPTGSADPVDARDDLSLCCTTFDPGSNPVVRGGPEPTPNIVADSGDLIDPYTWLDELVMRETPVSFVRACAGVISDISNAVEVSGDGEDVRVLALELQDGRIRLIIKNDSLYYALPALSVGRLISSVAVVTDFPCKEITPDGPKFCIRVPGRGVVIVDLVLETPMSL